LLYFKETQVFVYYKTLLRTGKDKKTFNNQDADKNHTHRNRLIFITTLKENHFFHSFKLQFIGRMIFI